MEIGIDDIDFIENDEVTTLQQQDTLETKEEEPQLEEEDDFVSILLKTRGIEDKSKIKFENDEGETEELNWDSLDNDTKLNILNSSTNNLDDSEILLINAVRQSQMSPAEYIQYIQQDTINRYLQNQQSTYKVDELSDDELFVTDFIARTGVTEEEAFEALDKAKSNENLFKKLIGAMRTEYKNYENEAIQYDELQQKQAAQEQFNLFAEGVKNQIIDFTEFAGCDLNMNDEDKQELYDFITGKDAAGNSYFGKALNDPATLVKMAWFALNGEQMIQDINEYYKKEISNVRKESYNKGLHESKDKPSIVHKNIQNSVSKSFDDLDDF